MNRKTHIKSFVTTLDTGENTLLVHLWTILTFNGRVTSIIGTIDILYKQDVCVTNSMHNILFKLCIFSAASHSRSILRKHTHDPNYACRCEDNM